MSTVFLTRLEVLYIPRLVPTEDHYTLVKYGIRHNSYTITFKENVCMQIVFLCPRLDVIVMF